MQTWMQLSQIVINFVQTFGIVVGGIWVYFKFFRSHTYTRRAQLDVQAGLLRVGNHQVIRVEVVLKNVGLSKLVLAPDKQFAFLQATKVSNRATESSLESHDVNLCCRSSPPTTLLRLRRSFKMRP